MTSRDLLPPLEVILENWWWTWEYHQGDVELAAHRLKVSHQALERMIHRKGKDLFYTRPDS